MAEMRCPGCAGPLRIVPRNPMLNEDQWDSVKAGDYYCEKCPDNGRGKSGLHYVWRHEALAAGAGAGARGGEEGDRG